MTITIQELVDDALITEVDETIASLTGNDPPVLEIVDMGFMQVGIKATSKIETFVQFVRENIGPGLGIFQEMDLDRLAQGPSYIELGAWIGDQTNALIFMALGKHHGAWDIITPATLGIPRDDPRSREMMGMGFVMTSGLNPNFRTLLEAP